MHYSSGNVSRNTHKPNETWASVVKKTPENNGIKHFVLELMVVQDKILETLALFHFLIRMNILPEQEL